MAKRTSFLIRVDPEVLDAIRKWSDDELRSVNGQIEYVLRSSLAAAGRLPKSNDDSTDKDEKRSKDDR